MKPVWAQFLIANDGAVLGWALLATWLAALIAVSLLTARRAAAQPDPVPVRIRQTRR